MEVREEVDLKRSAGVLLNVDPQEATKIVGEAHTTNRATLGGGDRRGR